MPLGRSAQAFSASDEMSKSAQIAVRSGSLETASKGSGEANKGIGRGGERRDLKGDDPIRREARDERLLAALGMTWKGAIGESPPCWCVDHRDDAAWRRYRQHA